MKSVAFELPGYGTFFRVLVVGAARSGIAAARLLAERGALVVVVDKKPASALTAEATELERLGVATSFGGHPPELAAGCDLVVVSPGVPLGLPVLAAARGRGVPVIGEIELAYPFIAARTVGITGSNGKSTTTALVVEIGRAAGLAAEPAGNFGRPLAELAGAGLDLVAISFRASSSSRSRGSGPTQPSS